MLAVAGGILLALFVLLMLWGLILVIRDGARFARRHLGLAAVVLAFAACAYVSWLLG